MAFLDDLANFGKSVISAPVKFVNTGLNQANEIGWTGVGAFAQLTNNRQLLNQALKQQNNARKGHDNGGILGMGSMYSSEDAKKGDLLTGAKKIGGGTLETAATVLPFAKGGSVALGLGKSGILRSMPKLAGEGAIYGGMYSTGQQLRENGGVDLGQLARDTAIGSVANVAVPLALRGAKNTAIGLRNAQMSPAAQAGFAKVPGGAGKKALPAAQQAAKPAITTTGRVGTTKTTLPAAQYAPQQKLSRFANKTIQKSDEVSTPLKKLVKDEQAGYLPTTDADRLKIADDWLKRKSGDNAYTQVAKKFEDPKNVNDQDIVTAIQTMKKLDASGKEGDIMKATEIGATLSKVLSKRGQEIQAASLLSARTPQGLIYQAEKAIRNGGGKLDENVAKEIRRLADVVKKQKPGTYEDGLARFKLMEFADKQVPTSFGRKATNVWKAGLLTAPTTTAGNISANLGEQFYKRAYKDPVATGFDVLFSLFTGKRSRTATLKGLGGGLHEGVGKTAKFFKTGYDPRNPLKKFDVNNIHYSDTPLGRAAEKYTQSVFRLMGVADHPFYYASFRNSLADQAITAAKNNGLKGQARKEFIEKYTTQPSKEALDMADKEARYDIFGNQTKLGDLASGIKQKTGAVGDFIIPFSQVPSSLAMRMIDRTPIGLAKEIVKQIRAKKFDQRAMTAALSDASAGIAMIGAGAALAKSDLITLGFPNDQTERDLWELEGRQPNSIRVGDQWLSLNYFQPLGTLLAAGANYEKAKATGEDPIGAYSAMIAGAGKALMDQSFLKGVSGVLNAVNDPQRFAETFSENTVGSVVPNIIRSTARSFDPVQREQDNVGDALMAGIPGLRQQLDVRTDIFGQPVPRKTSALNSFVNPLRPSDVRQETDVNTELRRLFGEDLGITGTKINKDALGKDMEGNEIVLDDKQRRELGNINGPELQKAWSEVISNPSYQTLDDQGKRDALERAKKMVNATAKLEYASQKGIEIGSTGSGTKIAKGLSGDSKKILQTVDLLDEAGKNKLFNEQNDAEYLYEKAKYENNLASGAYTKAQEARAKLDLAKAEVGKEYPKEVRDLYGLSKNLLYPLLQQDGNGQALAEQILAYDDALTAAGLQTKSKFRDRYGNVALAPSSGGSGGGRGGSNSNSAAIAATSSAARRAAAAKVSSRGGGFQNKIAARGLQAYKKPTATKVRVA